MPTVQATKPKKKRKVKWGGKRPNSGRHKILTPCPWCKVPFGVRDLQKHITDCKVRANGEKSGNAPVRQAGARKK